MAEVGESALLAVALAVEPGIAVGGRGVGIVPALLATEVGVAVATASPIVATFVPWPGALHRRPGFDQRAIDAEVLGRGQPGTLGRFSTSARNRAATSPPSSRSRFLKKVE